MHVTTLRALLLAAALLTRSVLGDNSGAAALGDVTYTTRSDGVVTETTAPGRGPVGVHLDDLDRVADRYTPTASASARYNSSGDLTDTTGVLGLISTFTRDATTGDLTSSSDNLVGTSNTIVTRDPNGNVVEFKDAMNRTWLQEFDKDNRRTKVTAPDGIQTQMTYTSGGLVKSVSVAGQTTQFQHNALGQVTRVVDPSGRTSSAVYDAFGLKTAETSGTLRTSYSYDANTRLLMAVTAPGGRTTAM